MGIRVKSIALVLGILVPGLVLVVVYGALQLAQVEQESFQTVAEELIRMGDEQLDAKSDVWLSNALLIAKNPMIEVAVDQGDRETASFILAELGRVFRENTTFRNVQVQLLDRDLRTLVRSWDPNNYGDYQGDSPIFAQVWNSGTAAVALEPSPSGYRLRGVFPVIIDGVKVGLVNFEGGLNSIKRNLEPAGVEFAYFLNDEYLASAQGLRGARSIGPWILSQNDVNEEFYEFLGANPQVLDLQRGTYLAAEPYFAVSYPVIGPDGVAYGRFVLAELLTVAAAVVNSNAEILMVLAVMSGSLLLVFAIVFFVFLSRSVASPVLELSHKFTQLSGGDFTLEIEEKNRSYLANLIHSTKSMVHGVSELLASIQDSALDFEAKQLSIEEKIKETLDATAGISQSSAHIQIQALGLDHKIIGAGEAMDAIAQNVSQLVRHIESQSSSVTQTTAAVEEMSANIRSIASIADQRASTAQSMVETTREGRELMGSALASVEKIGEEMEAVMEMVEVINTVASQTNLLAMNAAIEAAHAGEAGKGFTVVSEEIHHLSESTRESTEQISQTIMALAANVREAVEASRKAEEVIGSMAAGSEGIIEALGEINESTSQLSLGAEEVVNSAEFLLHSSQSTSSAVDQIQGAVNQIQQLMEGVTTAGQEVSALTGTIRSRSAQVNLAMNGLTTNSTKTISSQKSLFHALAPFSTAATRSEEQNLALKRITMAELIMQHALWMTKARAIIDCTLEVEAEEIGDHTQCALGAWLAAEGRGVKDEYPSFAQLDHAHQVLHQKVKTIVDLSTNDSCDDGELEEHYEQLVASSTEVIDHLKAIQQSYGSTHG